MTRVTMHASYKLTRIITTCAKEGITYVHFINWELDIFTQQQNRVLVRFFGRVKIFNEQFYKACYI